MKTDSCTTKDFRRNSIPVSLVEGAMRQCYNIPEISESGVSFVEKRFTIRQRTQFDEERARKMLAYVYPEKYGDAVLSDAPDIVCERFGIGIEVTSGLRQDILQDISRAACISGKMDDELTKIDRVNIEKDRVLSLHTDSGMNIAATWATWGSTFDHETILQKKCCKLNKPHFRVFNRNELFIFAWLIDQDELNEAIEYIASRKWIAEDTKRGFDTIYIFDDKVLTEVVVNGMHVAKHMIPNSIMHQISEEAYQTIRNCDKE